LVLVFFVAGGLFLFCAAGLLKWLVEFVHELIADADHGFGGASTRAVLNFSAVFVCILLANLTGILPFSFTLTAALGFPFSMSLAVFFAYLFTAAQYGRLFLFGGLLPSGASAPIVPLIVAVELVSTIAKFISLGVRLFANLFAGHLLLKVFYTIGFCAFAFFTPAASFLSAVSFVFTVFIVSLEILIAGLQAFVFLLLVLLYFIEAEDLTIAH